MNTQYNPKTTLFCSGLDQQVTSNILRVAFIPFGDIVQVQLPTDPSDPSKHRGFGFVEFESSQDAQDAIDNLNLSELFGKTIKVSLARPTKSKEMDVDPSKPSDTVWIESDEEEEQGDQVNQETESTQPKKRPELGLVQPKRSQLISDSNPTAYFDIQVDGTMMGRIIMLLRADVCPSM